MMVKTKVRAANEHKRKMEVLFRLADENRDGRLERDEFLEVLRDPTIKTWLASMDLAVDDQETLFDLLSGDDGAISLEELIGGISQLKGPARSIDLRKLMRAIEAPREP
jgi:Ca2+-binding EF-hand superfamily protein